MNRKVRLGFIGAGWWATTNHMPILAARDDVEFVAVATLGEDLLRKVQERFDFQMGTEDHRELLDQELDGVVVSTPHHLHYEHARDVLNAGFHVLVEKPMALNPQHAWELVRLAHGHERHLVVGYGWHYKPFVRAARRLIGDGGVGRIRYVVCHMASPTKELFSGTGGAPSRWTPTLSQPDPRTWQVPEQGGGYAHGQITHSSALLFWLTGLRAREVSAVVRRASAAVDLYDAATVTYDGDEVGTVSGAGTLPADDPFQVDLRIFGDDGVLLFDVERERVELRRHDGDHVSIEVAAGEGAYSCEGPPTRFVELIQGYGENESPGVVAAKSVELIDAIHRSAAEDGASIPVWREKTAQPSVPATNEGPTS